MALGLGGGNDIRIRFLADTSQVGPAVTEMGGGISKGLNMAGIGWAAAGAAAGLFARQSVDAALEAQAAQAKLADVYQRFPALHDASLRSLNELADATMRKTKFDDEAVRAGEAVLAQFNLTGAQLKELVPLVADYAQTSGKEFPDAAEAVGKALLGNTRALKEIGVNYKLTGDAATDYGNIIALLAEKVGGSAEAYLDTPAGKLEALKNQYGELQEQIGTALLPLIQYLAPALIEVLQVLSMSFQGWGLLISWVAEHANGLGQILELLVGGPILWLILNTNIVSTALSWLGSVFGWVGGIISGAFAAAVNWVVGAFHDVWGVIMDVAHAVGGVFAGAWHAAVGAINAVGRAIAWVIDKLNALKGVWDAVSGVIGKIGGIIGLSAPVPPAGGSGAPSLALAGTSSARARSGRSGSTAGGAGLAINVNVYGNVGDPNVIGRRTVEALNTYVRTNGARALRTELGLA